MTSETDRIEQEVLIHAPREKVWRALTDAREFGAWFGVDITGKFEPGARIEGRILNPEWAHVPFVIDIDRVQQPVLLTWRWGHPDRKAPPADLSKEPQTYVSFDLSEVSEGTLLKVIESGFDALPATRRADAFRDNTAGWKQQTENIRKYVEAGAA